MASEVIPLKEAYLCLDCEVISKHSDGCPKCAGKVMHPLSTFLKSDIPVSVRMVLHGKPKFDGHDNPPPASSKK